MAHAAGPWQGDKPAHSSIWSRAIILLCSLALMLVPVLMPACNQLTKQLANQPAKKSNRKKLWLSSRAGQPMAVPQGWILAVMYQPCQAGPVSGWVSLVCRQELVNQNCSHSLGFAPELAQCATKSQINSASSQIRTWRARKVKTCPLKPW